MSFLRRLFFCAIVCASSPSAVAQTSFAPLEPSIAAQGDTVTIPGEGFDPELDYEVFVEGTFAEVTEVTEGFLRFLVPADALSGEVVVGIENVALPHLDELTVTRTLPVSTASGLVLNNYSVGSAYGESPWLANGNMVSVARGRATLVAASGDVRLPSYFTYVTDSMDTVELNAATTAAALCFMSSIAFTTDPANADALLAFLREQDAVESLAELVTLAASSGTDVLEHPDFEGHVITALEAVLASGLIDVSGDASGKQADGRGEDYVGATFPFDESTPRDLKLEGLELLDRLVPSAEAARNNGRAVPELGIRYDPGEVQLIGGFSLPANPIDWIANVYELDPLQDAFARGALDAAELGTGDAEQHFARVQPNELHRVSVPAKPITANLNIAKKARDLLFADIIKPFDSPPVSRIPADRSGLYMIRAFSGSYFTPQSDLLDALPQARREHLLMIKVNISLAALESVSALADVFGVFSGEAVAGILFKTEGGVLATLIREEAQGTLNDDLYRTLYREVLEELVKAITQEVTKQGVQALLGPLKGLTKIASVTSKVGSVTERIFALTNVVNFLAPQGITAYSGQSIESTLAVVGDPWRPEITSFSPREGHRGTVVRIQGRRFSENIEELSVAFNPELSTDPDAPISAPAEIIDATRTAITVRVPEGAGDGAGVILVRVENRGEFTTGALASPYENFEVLPDPVLTSLEPMSPLLTNIVLINGQYFAPRREDNLVNFGTEFSMNAVKPISVNPAGTELVVKTPFAFGDTSVAVEVSGRTSNTLNYSPDLGEGESGNSILVNTLADGDNPADPAISLHEAILFAAGVRAPTSPPSERPEGAVYESDFIGGCPGLPPPNGGCALGPGFSNQIGFNIGLTGGTIQLAGPLPALASGDRINFGNTEITIDGGGMAGDCFLLDGKVDIEISNAHIVNFAGSGVRLTGGSSNNLITQLFVQECEHGVLLDEAATGNRFEYTRVDLSTSHGVVLRGEGVAFNQFGALKRFNEDTVDTSTRNQGYGVLVEDGARFNIVDLGAVKENEMAGYRVQGLSTLGNHIGLPDDLSTSVRGQVWDNQGPGVHVTSPQTTVRRLSIGGNEGDGVLIEGADCQHIEVSLCTIGYGFQDEERPNLGTGIHVRDGASGIVIGATDNVGREDPVTYVSGNRDYGIWLEGSGTNDGSVHDVKLRMTLVGLPNYKDGFALSYTPLPNGISGIYISAGAHDIEIGDADPYLGVASTGHQEGAGLLIEGPETRDIRIGNSTWGQPPALSPIYIFGGPFSNKYGIHIRGGARNITIGTRGGLPAEFEPRYRPFENTNDPFFPDHMVLFETSVKGNLGAGIFIDDTGGEIPDVGTRERGAPPVTPVNGIVIQNVGVGRSHSYDDFSDEIREEPQGNAVGILIQGDNAIGNRIGGSESDEGNQIVYSYEAGLRIENSAVAPAHANRIIGNRIENGFVASAEFESPLGDEPGGIGVHILNSSGHTLGGEGAGEGNRLTGNLTGVLVQDATGIAIVNNLIGSEDLGATKQDRAGELAGVVLRDTTETVVGPKNRIVQNGFPGDFTAAAPLGGVYIHGGSKNTIAGNWIGTDSAEMALLGNVPMGVTIDNSSENLIGGAGFSNRNVIADSGEHGVLITGTLSMGNQLAENFIGVPSFAIGVPMPNSGDGVRIDGGASNNTIGGDLEVVVRGTQTVKRVSNAITGNGGNGVTVSGGTGNTILNNAISTHGGAGISLIAGGNADLPAPTITSVLADRVLGTVDEMVVPDGSLVQVFSDAADEGEAFEGEGSVSNGAFEILTGARLLGNVNATVTHPGSGDTSPFGTPRPILPTLDIRRLVDPPAEYPLAPGSSASVVAMRLTTGEAPVTVDRMTFVATGTADLMSDVDSLRIYEDVDQNGFLSSLDVPITEAASPGDGDGEVLFEDMGAVLGAGSISTWLLVVQANAEAPIDATISFRLESSLDIRSLVGLLSTELQENGNFPLDSDTFVLSETVEIAALALDVISVTVGADSGDQTIEIRNSGNATLSWSTEVIEGAEFLSILAGASGENNGVMTFAFEANITNVDRTGRIRIVAPGAFGSPVEVTVTQLGAAVAGEGEGEGEGEGRAKVRARVSYPESPKISSTLLTPLMGIVMANSALPKRWHNSQDLHRHSLMPSIPIWMAF